MTETIRYGQIGKQDIRFGTGQFEVELADGRIVTLTELNSGHLPLIGYALASLPPAGTAGRLARVTDDNRGLRTDTGTIWSAKGRIFYAEDFDVHPDRTAAQNSTGLAALMTAVPNGAKIVLPPGIIQVNSLFQMLNKEGLVIEGPGFAGGSEIRWAGAAGGTLMNIQGSRFITMRDVWLNGNNVAATSLLLDNQVGNTFPTIINSFTNVRFGNVTGTAIAIGSTNNRQTDSFNFYNCFIENYGVGVLVEGTVTFNINFIGGHISALDTVPSTVGFDLVNGGNLNISNMQFIGSANTIGFFRRSRTFLNVSISDSEMENAGPFFVGLDDTASNNNWPVTLKNVIIGFTGAGGTNIIDYQQRGPFLIYGGDINSTNAANINFASPATGGGVVKEEGVRLVNISRVYGANSFPYRTDASGAFIAGNISGHLFGSGTAVSGVTQTIGQAATDDTLFRMLAHRAGGGSANATQTQYTTTGVAGVAKTIASLEQRANLIIVAGNNGAAFFVDLVVCGQSSATPTVAASNTDSGAPAARTYSTTGSALQLVMASGTYSIHTHTIALTAR